ncbi:MAG TPA: ATP-dependent helicase C-terminal domain-containing protein [Thermoanaerobaculia bacterium]|nr:ATP-dependent helicase C-terminal domain-containing protein [Thermoanaerobaculia bacterium]
MILQQLPIDDFIDEIVKSVRRERAAIIVAPPGSGKSTRVPPALVADGPVILLQPRRVAARMLTLRIAEERGWEVGKEIGWHIRFERRFSKATRLLLATEGILTARLRSDPLLLDFNTIVIDEFHERSIHADLALAFAREAFRARQDLRLVVMSATLDTAPVARFLDGAPVINIGARTYPIDIEYRPGQSVPSAVREVLPTATGDVLCFLPGAAEITGAAAELRTIDAEVRLLYGSLPSADQDAALSRSSAKRVILATNVAETSLTVEGVSDVIDAGLQKVLRFDSSTGVDRLVLERVPRDSADQRAGRAGRTGPGRARRLWDERDILRTQREPDIARIDLCGPLLDVMAWGGKPDAFGWFEPPAPRRLEAAMEVLTLLGAVHGGAVTNLGRILSRLPVHPRIGRLLLATGGSRKGALAAALLSEGVRLIRGAAAVSSESDLLTLLEQRGRDDQTRRVADQLQRALEGSSADLERFTLPGEDEETAIRRATFLAYSDRLARRRERGSDRFLLASGHGAAISRESGVRDALYLVALDVSGAERGGTSEALIRMASAVESEWIEPTTRDIVHFYDAESETVRCREKVAFKAVVLLENHCTPDDEIAASLLASKFLERPSEAWVDLQRRARFAGIDFRGEEIVAQAFLGRRTLRGVSPETSIDPRLRRELDRLAPLWLEIPSGRKARLGYRENGEVFAAVKLQELFGLAETPRIGSSKTAITFELLAPNGRAVQTTRDLRSFWEGAYQEVRKELRGRYPRHPWPEDPWTATPTARTRRR